MKKGKSEGIQTLELDKLAKVRDQSQLIGEFLEHLKMIGIVLAEYRKDDLIPVCRSTEQHLADYFGIDLEEAERERQALLKRIQGGK